MAWFPCKVGGSGGIPAQLQTDMDAVLNKKFGTSTTYPSTDWADDVNLMGLLPVRSASGAIASFSDGADDVPIKSGKFTFNAVQASGTPTPSVPIPISGFTGMNVVRMGKNLFDWATVQTGYRVVWGTGVDYADESAVKSDYIPVKAGGTYAFTSLCYVLGYDSLKTYLGAYNASDNNFAKASGGQFTTLTIPSGCSYIKVMTFGTATAIDNQFVVAVGSTAPAYTAYIAPQTYPVTWTSEGTLYGGYVKVNSDGSAELWKTDEMVDMGDLSWTYTNSVFRATLSDGVVLSSANISPDYLCSCYLPKASGNSAKWSDDLVCWHGTGSYCYVYVTNSNYTDADVFATAMTGQKLVYELATPVKVCDLPDINISTLLGTNNIFHDANGDSEIEYRQMGTVIWNGQKTTTAFSTPITFDGIDISQYTYIQLTFYAFKSGVSYTYNDLTVKVSDIPKNASYESASDILQIASAGSGSTLYAAYVRRDLNDMLYLYVSTNYTNVAVLLKGA